MSRSIYEVVKLAYADVVQYRKVLERIETDAKYIGMTYRDARDAIIEYHRMGDVAVLDAEIRRLGNARSRAMKGSKEHASAKNNEAVLRGYKKHFASPFRPLQDGTPGTFETFTATFNGMTLTGKPHLAVSTPRGKAKFLYILASLEMNDDEKRLYVALLSELVVANCSGATHRDVEGLDCRTDKRIRTGGLGIRRRPRVEFVTEELKQKGFS